MASIAATLSVDPTRVVLAHSDVPRAAWDEVGLAFNASTLSGEPSLALDLDAFLRGAALFTGVLSTYRIDFIADAGITDLLRRRTSDRQALSDALIFEGRDA